MGTASDRHSAPSFPFQDFEAGSAREILPPAGSVELRMQSFREVLASGTHIPVRELAIPALPCAKCLGLLTAGASPYTRENNPAFTEHLQCSRPCAGPWTNTSPETAAGAMKWHFEPVLCPRNPKLQGGEVTAQLQSQNQRQLSTCKASVHCATSPTRPGMTESPWLSPSLEAEGWSWRLPRSTEGSPHHRMRKHHSTARKPYKTIRLA